MIARPPTRRVSAARVSVCPRGAHQADLRDALPGLIAWWDVNVPGSLYTDTGLTSVASASGASVAGLRDLTGNGYHWTASVAPTLSLAAVNGRKGLAFNGSSQWMNANGLVPYATGSDQPFTVWLVCLLGQVSATQTPFAFGGSSVTPFCSCDVTNIGAMRLERRDDASTLVAPAANTQLQASRLYLLLWSFTGTGVNFFVNRAGTGPTTGGTSADVGVMTVDRCSLGTWQRTTNSQYSSMTFLAGGFHTVPLGAPHADRLTSLYVERSWTTP